jgi:hypothetical protein
MTTGRLRSSAQWRGACLAAGQEAAVRTNATLDLRTSKVERYWGAKLHSRLLLLRIIMRMVIIEEAG